MTSRLRHRCISQAISQQYVPLYNPPCCPTPTNTDPRRTEAYCPPTRSFSEPLSHAEYLRRLKANNNAPLSSTNTLVQYGEGEYKKTIWTESTVGGACCPVDPTVPAAQKTLDAGMHTMMKGAKAAAVKGINDKNGVPESLHTLQKQGQAIFTEQCPGVSCQEQIPPEPIPPVVIQYTYLSVQSSSGNFMYYVFDEFYNQWSFVTDSGFDGTYTYNSAGFTGNKFFTSFTKAGVIYYQFIDLKGTIVNQFETPLSLSFANTGSSNVIFYYSYVVSTAPTTLQLIRYEPYSNTLLQTSQSIASISNLAMSLFYNTLFIRYRSSNSPITIQYALWPITQDTVSAPAYTSSTTLSFFINTNFASSISTIANNTLFTFNSDGQSVIVPISGTSVIGSIGLFGLSGAGPSQKGRFVIRINRASYFELYIYDYDTMSLIPIYLNPDRRVTTAANMNFIFLRSNTYNSGLTTLSSNSIQVHEQNSSSYTNAITLTNVIRNGNYTDISGSITGGRSFHLSRIAYNTYYQENDFGYITGNNDHPVVTLLRMTDGSTWIQASGTISSERNAASVTNTSGSYSINPFFTINTLVPILEPNDPTVDLPTTSNALNERSWWALHQDITRRYKNDANVSLNQGVIGMIIRPRNNTQIVRQIQFRSTDNSNVFDPIIFKLEGSNDDGATYTTIVANGSTNILSVSRTFIYSSDVFANTEAYVQYRLTFLAIRFGAEMQVQKVQFLAETPAGYLVDGTLNGSLTLLEGQVYDFKVNAPDDIFWIQTVPAPYSPANVYSTGVVNNGCKTSILQFTVPVGAPSTLYYVSQTNPTKTGTITIVPTGTPVGNISGSWWAHTNFNATNRSMSEIWFTIENANQWGSNTSLVQDTRPSIAPASDSPYRYVMGVTGQNYMFGKMLFTPNSVSAPSVSTLQAIVGEYVRNLALSNSFSGISLPSLYSHITPTTAYSMPSFQTGVLTTPNGFSVSSSSAITFNVSSYTNITVTNIVSTLVSAGSQVFNLWYRIGGVEHIPGSPPVIDPINGWVQVWVSQLATPTLLSSISNRLYSIPISVGLQILAGQTVGFCLHSSSGISYQNNSVGSSAQFFENNDFRVTVGDNAGYGTNQGPTVPFTGIFTPRSFAGIIQAVRSTLNDAPILPATTFLPLYRIGTRYTLLGNEIVPRTFDYNTPNLFVSSMSSILFNNKEYICMVETDQYTVNLRIIRSLEEGDIVVPIRQNMILLPSTFSQSIQLNAFLGYVYIDINFQGTQRNWIIARLTDGAIVASGVDPNFSFFYSVTGGILVRVNSNGTVSMFRNGIYEEELTNTFTSLSRMRSDTGTNDAMFPYSIQRALAFTSNGYNVVQFPVPLTIINSTIQANNCLTLIQLNPFAVYVIDRDAELYTYTLNQAVTLVRRLNTDQSMTVHVSYTGPGPATTRYTLRMTDAVIDGWNGARMELRQGATVVTEIGSTFTVGSGPIDIVVTLTEGLSYSLVWTNGGGFASEVGVQILDPSGISVYQMPFNSQALVSTTLTTFTAQSLPTPTFQNLYVTFDVPTKQFITNTTFDNVNNLVSNFIYQPA